MDDLNFIDHACYLCAPRSSPTHNQCRNGPGLPLRLISGDSQHPSLNKFKVQYELTTVGWVGYDALFSVGLPHDVTYPAFWPHRGQTEMFGHLFQLPAQKCKPNEQQLDGLTALTLNWSMIDLSAYVITIVPSKTDTLLISGVYVLRLVYEWCLP